jgi:DNA repair photolyase
VTSNDIRQIIAHNEDKEGRRELSELAAANLDNITIDLSPLKEDNMGITKKKSWFRRGLDRLTEAVIRDGQLARDGADKAREQASKTKQAISDKAASVFDRACEDQPTTK